MNKDTFIKEFYEQKIFNEMKDIYFGGVRELKRRYGELDINYSDIYRKIINYRIKRYGTAYISPPDSDAMLPREFRVKNAIKRKNARYKRRKREDMK